MKKSLFERIIEQFMQNPYFADFKFKKSESMLYVPTSDGMYFVEFEHWIDYGELVIYTYYGRRFEILIKLICGIFRYLSIIDVECGV